MTVWTIHARAHTGDLAMTIGSLQDGEGDPLDPRFTGRGEDYTSLEFETVNNDSGSWILSGVPDDSALAALLKHEDGRKGHQGIEVHRNGVVVFSGRVVEADYSDDEDGRTWEFRGSDDTGRLAGAYVSPDYDARPPWATTILPANAPGETILYGLVRQNVGPDALPERQDVIPGLALLSDGERGQFVERFFTPDMSVLQALQDVAAVDGFRFFILPIAGVLTYQVILPPDRRAEVLFSRSSGTLGRLRITESAAAGNALLLMAGKDGTRQVTLSDEQSVNRYGRWELVEDRSDQETVDQMAVAGAKSLEENAGGITVSLDMLSDVLAWIDQYDVGDRVACDVPRLGEIDGYISRVKVSITGGQDGAVRVVPTFTSARFAPPSGFLGPVSRRLSRTAEQLSRLAASQEQWVRGDLRPWWRAIEEFPYPGYQIPDGTNGTPDLQDMVLYTTGGSYDLLDEIGDNTPDLPNLSNHQHTIANADLAHSHLDNGGTGHGHLHSHPIPQVTVNFQAGASALTALVPGTATSNGDTTTAATISSGQPAGTTISTSAAGSATLGTLDVRPFGKAIHWLAKL